MPKTKSSTKSQKINRPFFITHKYDERDIATYQELKPAPILFVKNLTKKYFGKKKPAINNLNFNVYPGQFHAFIGANGAGKTTTIKCLIGAYANWNGTVLIDGHKNNKEMAKKKLGYIPENARFPEKLSAIKYLQWMTMLSGLAHKQAKQYAIHKLKSLKMWSLRNKSPNTFSSGQKKKILLAQALIHNPKIIIMDEPVANLDPKARIEFFDLLMQLRKKGKAIFISSHVLAELDLYADSATILDGGEIIYDGDKKTLMQKFTSNQYEIVTDNNRLVKQFLRKNHITYSEMEETGGLIVDFQNQKMVKKLQRQLLDAEIIFSRFAKIEPTLDQVYNKLIVKGSVDTQEG